MGELAVRQPHLGRDTIGLLGRIVDAGECGLTQDDIEPYLLVRLLRCGYVRRRREDSPFFIATPAGIARSQFEAIQARHRQDEFERREIIRGRIQAMAERLAIAPAPMPVMPALRDLPGYRERPLPPFEIRQTSRRVPALAAPRASSRGDGGRRESPEDALQVIRDAELRARRERELPAPGTGDVLAPEIGGARLVHIGRLPEPRGPATRECHPALVRDEALPAIVVTDVPDPYQTGAGSDDAAQAAENADRSGEWRRAAIAATAAAMVLMIASPLSHREFPLVEPAPSGTHAIVSESARRTPTAAITPARTPAMPAGTVAAPATPTAMPAMTKTALATPTAMPARTAASSATPTATPARTAAAPAMLTATPARTAAAPAGGTPIPAARAATIEAPAKPDLHEAEKPVITAKVAAPTAAIPAVSPAKPPAAVAPVAIPAVALVALVPAPPEPKPQAAPSPAPPPPVAPLPLAPLPFPSTEAPRLIPAATAMMPIQMPEQSTAEHAPSARAGTTPPKRLATRRPDHSNATARAKHPDTAIETHTETPAAPPAMPQHDALAQVMARLRAGARSGDSMVDRLNALSLQAALHGRVFVPPDVERRAAIAPEPPRALALP